MAAELQLWPGLVPPTPPNPHAFFRKLLKVCPGNPSHGVCEVKTALQKIFLVFLTPPLRAYSGVSQRLPGWPRGSTLMLPWKGQKWIHTEISVLMSTVVTTDSQDPRELFGLTRPKSLRSTDLRSTDLRNTSLTELLVFYTKRLMPEHQALDQKLSVS